jgi:hypothetical protein
VLEEPDVTFPIEGHLSMRPNNGFIDLVSISRPPHCVSLFFLILTLDFMGRCRVSSALSTIPVR